MLALRSIVSIVVLPGTVSVFVPWRLIGIAPAPDGLAWLGLAPLGVGIALFAWCVWDFGTRGRGTLAPWDAPRRLVVTGPYRVVRNPMYVAVFLVLLGEAILFTSVLVAAWLAAFALLAQTFVVVYEEPSLASTFGDAYREYAATVGRWLPRRPPPVS